MLGLAEGAREDQVVVRGLLEDLVQRCRHHKIENVVGYLPDELQDQVKAVMRAAFRLPKKEGMAMLEKQAQWLEREYPSAAASLCEGKDWRRCSR